ncbi:hypothetical protein [Paenibacillus sp. HB172176]|uniref:hypothetical protein n=1 Tax=Paenibacillus sp. HB172176 TaxID=2493690 RepID=UPI0014399F6D|nr:hypothetical protein [Paenibacillus sp. HB172176]
MNRSGEHLSMERLRGYMSDTLGGQERQEVERELYACDECLRRWIALQEEIGMSKLLDREGNQATQLPSQPDFAGMEEAVMERILAEHSMHESAEQSSSASQVASLPLQEQIVHDRYRPSQQTLNATDKTRRRSGSWLRLPAVQYTIAASITIVLMATGAFTGLADTLRDIDENIEQPPYASAPEESELPLDSWSQHLFDRANHWLEHVESARFNSNS